MAPDKPSIVTTFSHEEEEESSYIFEVTKYIFEVTKYIFEVTKYIFEVTKYIFEVTGTFRKHLYISELQRHPNSNILFAYLCIYVARLLYTKAKGKRKGFWSLPFSFAYPHQNTQQKAAEPLHLQG